MTLSVVGNAVNPLTGLLSLPLLTHALGVTGRGEVAATTAPLLLAVAVATFGIPEATTYAVARSRHFGRAVARRSVGLGLIGGALSAAAVFAATPLLTDDQSDGHLMRLVGLLAIPTIPVSVLRGAAGGLGHWRRVMIERAATSLIRLIALLVLAVLGRLDVLAAVLVIAGSPVLGLLFYWRMDRSSEGTEVGPSSSTRTLLSYGMRVWAGSVSATVLARIDQTLMVPLANSRELGLYAVAVSISELPLVITAAVRDVLFASQARTQDTSRIGMVARVSTAACAIVGCGLLAVIPATSDWLLGPGFGDAFPAIVVLVAAVVVSTPGSVAGAALSATGRPGLRSTSLAVAGAVNVLLLFWLIPAYGALGAAVATLVGNAISSNMNFVFVRQLTDIRFFDFYGLRRADVRSFALVLKRRMRGSTSGQPTAGSAS